MIFKSFFIKNELKTISALRNYWIQSKLTPVVSVLINCLNQYFKNTTGIHNDAVH